MKIKTASRQENKGDAAEPLAHRKEQTLPDPADRRAENRAPRAQDAARKEAAVIKHFKGLKIRKNPHKREDADGLATVGIIMKKLLVS